MGRNQIARCVGYTARLVAVGATVVVGLALGGGVAAAMGFPAMQVPGNAASAAAALPLACLLLAAGIAPLAARLAGRFVTRWAALSLLIYVCLGLNTAIEASIFTRMGGFGTLLVTYLGPAILGGAALAGLFRPDPLAVEPSPEAASGVSPWTAPQYAARLIAAVLVFAPIYYLFGSLAMACAPWALDFYTHSQFGLVLPSQATVLSTQILRGALFVAAAYPVIRLWRGTRTQLSLRLGLALFVLVGMFGMVMAFWMPPALRVVHGVEILADSLVHAWALAFLLYRPTRAVTIPSTAPAAAHAAVP